MTTRANYKTIARRLRSVSRLVLILGIAAILVSGLALAQTTADYFLHGTGPDNNPPTLLLNTTAPIAATAKFRDSAGVNFSGGNLWKEIGVCRRQ